MPNNMQNYKHVWFPNICMVDRALANNSDVMHLPNLASIYQSQFIYFSIKNMLSNI